MAKVGLPSEDILVLDSCLEQVLELHGLDFQVAYEPHLLGFESM